MLMHMCAARIYNKHLGDEHTGISPVQEMTLAKGDLTWFSPNWFQTHQLENATQDFCCTVQGFQYADDDDVHWPYMQFKVTAIFRIMRVFSQSAGTPGYTCSSLHQSDYHVAPVMPLLKRQYVHHAAPGTRHVQHGRWYILSLRRSHRLPLLQEG